MTELQRQYVELRESGRGHMSSINELARRLGLDQATVTRVLDRADREHQHPYQRPARPRARAA